MDQIDQAEKTRVLSAKEMEALDLANWKELANSSTKATIQYQDKTWPIDISELTPSETDFPFWKKSFLLSYIVDESSLTVVLRPNYRLHMKETTAEGEVPWA